MASNITTVNPFIADITVALDALNSLKRDKGIRPAAARAFLEADGDEARVLAVEVHGAGVVRRGLREAAVFFDAHGQSEIADAFWALRDDIDIDGDVFVLDVNAA